MRVDELLQEWWRRTFVSLVAHNCAEVRLRRIDRTLGSSAIALIIAVGGVALGFGVTSVPAKLIVALATLVASVLSFLQAYLGYGEAAAQHRMAARNQAALHRLIEHTLADPPAGARSLALRIEEIERWWNLSAAGTPNVPQRDRDYAEANVLAQIHAALNASEVPAFIPGARKV